MSAAALLDRPDLVPEPPCSEDAVGAWLLPSGVDYRLCAGCAEALTLIIGLAGRWRS